eukprot:Platyproteum_vivax@DN12153_c0_g1_i1.p1
MEKKLPHEYMNTSKWLAAIMWHMCHPPTNACGHLPPSLTTFLPIHILLYAGIFKKTNRSAGWFTVLIAKPSYGTHNQQLGTSFNFNSNNNKVENRIQIQLQIEQTTGFSFKSFTNPKTSFVGLVEKANDCLEEPLILQSQRTGGRIDLQRPQGQPTQGQLRPPTGI